MAKISIRRYTLEDIPRMLDLVEAFFNENRNSEEYTNHYKAIDFDRKKVYSILESRINDPDFFANLIYLDEEVVGGLCAYIATPFYSSDRIAYDQIFYITPTFTNVSAVIRLLRIYVKWAEQRKAVECRMCSSTKYKPEAFTKLCKLTGFEQFEIGFARRF